MKCDCGKEATDLFFEQDVCFDCYLHLKLEYDEANLQNAMRNYNATLEKIKEVNNENRLNNNQKTKGAKKGIGQL